LLLLSPFALAAALITLFGETSATPTLEPAESRLPGASPPNTKPASAMAPSTTQSPGPSLGLAPGDSIPKAARPAELASKSATPVTKAWSGVSKATLLRRAADAVSEGNTAEALALFRQLATETPSVPAYATAARILERHLAADVAQSQ
jgi:hypothetical protein